MPPEPSKLLLCGDTHCDLAHFEYLCRTAVNHNCDAIIVVGDLSYYPHTRLGVTFLAEVPKLLEEFNIHAYFLDGNHENFDVLFSEEWPIQDGFWRIRDRLFYIPRGHRWTWSGVKFLGLGGAYTFNKEDLLRWEARAHTSRFWWWPQEMVTVADIARVRSDSERVDVMLTHDVPYGVKIPGYIFSQYSPAYENRALLKEAMDHVKPTVLVHGHLHHHYTSLYMNDIYTTAVTGLANNGEGPNSWLVLDLGKVRGDINARQACTNSD